MVFGRPIGKNQGIQLPIARVYAETEAADLMIRKAAAMFDNGMACGAAANMSRPLGSQAPGEAAGARFETFGGVREVVGETAPQSAHHVPVSS